jgi:hypothetical protein
MVTITNVELDCGLRMPSNAEFTKLAKLVLDAHPDLAKAAAGVQNFVEEFRLSFWALNTMWKSEEPAKRYFADIVADINATLAQRSRPSVSGVAVLCAVIATGEIKFRLADDSKGQLLEVWVSKYQGASYKNVWRDIVAGRAKLLPPTPVDRERLQQIERSPVRIYKEDARGNMQSLEDGGSFWK